MKSILAALWGAVLFINSIPSSAMPILADEDTQSVKVDYSDLDLQHERGVKTLEGRVKRAVRSVCDVGGDRSFHEKALARDCASRARTQADADVSNVVNDARQSSDWRTSGAGMPARDWRDDIVPRQH